MGREAVGAQGRKIVAGTHDRMACGDGSRARGNTGRVNRMHRRAPPELDPMTRGQPCREAWDRLPRLDAPFMWAPECGRDFAAQEGPTLPHLGGAREQHAVPFPWGSHKRPQAPLALLRAAARDDDEPRLEDRNTRRSRDLVPHVARERIARSSGRARLLTRDGHEAEIADRRADGGARRGRRRRRANRAARPRVHG